MKKGKRNIFITIGIVLVVFVIALVWWAISLVSGPTYHAVYLDTGDIYFGQLGSFPGTVLHDAWYLQQDFENQQLALAEFSNVVWSPVGSLDLNNAHVVWTAKISKDSQIIPILEKRQQAQPNFQDQIPATPQEGEGTVSPGGLEQ